MFVAVFEEQPQAHSLTVGGFDWDRPSPVPPRRRLQALAAAAAAAAVDLQQQMLCISGLALEVPQA